MKNAEDSNKSKSNQSGGKAMTERTFTTYEEPLAGRTFTEKQMYEVYRDLADKNEYPTFECWFSDMLKSGVFEEVKQMQTVKTFTKADNGKLSKVLEYESGARVEIPINKDGSVRWFDDSKLLKASTK